MLYPSEKRLIVEKTKCAYCGATPSNWCRTNYGSLAKRLHMKRLVSARNFKIISRETVLAESYARR